jgi:hypothetical protein
MRIVTIMNHEIESNYELNAMYPFPPGHYRIVVPNGLTTSITQMVVVTTFHKI